MASVLPAWARTQRGTIVVKGVGSLTVHSTPSLDSLTQLTNGTGLGKQQAELHG